MTGRRAAECASAGTTLVSHERRGGRRESGRERLDVPPGRCYLS